jgi:hypothetical protein
MVSPTGTVAITALVTVSITDTESSTALATHTRHSNRLAATTSGLSPTGILSTTVAAAAGVAAGPPPAHCVRNGARFVGVTEPANVEHQRMQDLKGYGSAERHILDALTDGGWLKPPTVYDLVETYRPGGGLSAVQVLKQAAWRLRDKGHIVIVTGRTKNGRPAMAMKLR